MGKEESFVKEEVQAWNVASDYSRLKIMKFLYLIDEYEILATFGTSDILQELEVQVNVDDIRIKSFKRLVKYLLMLINNTIFAIKKPKDKETFNKLKKELTKIYGIIPVLYDYKSNVLTKTKEIYVKPEKFDEVLERVVEIKSELNDPLNKNELIFRYSEEFDEEAYKKQFMERMKRG